MPGLYPVHWAVSMANHGKRTYATVHTPKFAIVYAAGSTVKLYAVIAAGNKYISLATQNTQTPCVGRARDFCAFPNKI